MKCTRHSARRQKHSLHSRTFLAVLSSQSEKLNFLTLPDLASASLSGDLGARSKRPYRICSNFAISRQPWEEQGSLSDFLKKLVITINTRASKKRNGVIKCSDVNKTSIITNLNLYTIQLWWPFSNIFEDDDVMNVKTYEVFPLKNPVQPR